MDKRELEKRLKAIHGNREKAAQELQAWQRRNEDDARKWVQGVARPALEALRDALNDSNRGEQASVTVKSEKSLALVSVRANGEQFSFSISLQVSHSRVAPEILVNECKQAEEEVTHSLKGVCEWTQDDVQEIFLKYYERENKGIR